MREVWASLAICMIWLAVLFTAVYAPDIVTSSSGGSDTATIPSGFFVALFAVNAYGFLVAGWPLPLTVAIGAAVTFLMFSVAMPTM